MADNTQQALQEVLVHLRAINVVLSGIAGDAAPQEQPLPAWQDVLGEAEQLVKQKPIFAKYIKGTLLENDVPVWMAQAVMRDRAARAGLVVGEGAPAGAPAEGVWERAEQRIQAKFGGAAGAPAVTCGCRLGVKLSPWQCPVHGEPAQPDTGGQQP